MKDMLDNMLTKALKGAAQEDIQCVFVYGVQVVGRESFIYTMNITHRGLYLMRQVDQIVLPKSSNEFGFIEAVRTAVEGYLRLRQMMAETPKTINSILRTLPGKNEASYFI